MRNRIKKKIKPKIVSAINSEDGTIRECISVDGRLHDALTGQPLCKNWVIQPSGTIPGLIFASVLLIIVSLTIEYFSI